MDVRRLGWALLLLGTASAQGQVAPAPDDGGMACRGRAVQPDGRPRVGLALGGGGARGIAHISVLRKLEELRVPVDCIAGTSMGALIGALYASGMSVDDIEAEVLALDWTRVMDDSLERRERSYRRKTDDLLVTATPGVGIGAGGIRLTAGMLAGERILLLFTRMIEPVASIEHFNQLPIPYRAVAADINTGEPLVIGTGDLALAMRASMSLPGIFQPVQLGGRVVVDGGVARNLPVDVVRDMGADIVIAVDVGTPLHPVDAQSSLLAVTAQVTGLLTVGNTRQQLATMTERDVLVSPPLGNLVATSDFDKGPEAIEIGRLGAEAAGDELARLSIPDVEYARHLASRLGRQPSPPVVQFVRVENSTRYRDDLLLSRVDLPLGEPLDALELERSLMRVYGISTLSQARYEVVEEDDRTGVVLYFNEKIQGPNYLEAGLSMSSNFSGRFDSGLRVGVLQAPVNSRGGEMRYLLQAGDQTGLMVEYYQPFAGLTRYFFAGRAQYERRRVNVFDDLGRNTAQYSVAETGIGLRLGRELGNFGAVSVGYRRLNGDARLQVGDPDLPGFSTRTGEVLVEAAVDRLDSLFFPRAGYLARVRYTVSRGSLGADAEFEQTDLDAFSAWSIRKHSGLLGVRYHVTHSGVAPIQSLYRAGGYSRLVGFQPNQISGQHFAVLIGGYSYQLGRLFNQNAVVGGMLEYGNVWQDRSQMSFDDAVLNGSAYIGLDSWIGPLLFGVGAREGGQHNLFLEVGHRF